MPENEKDNYENNSRINGVIFAVLCGILIFSAIAFGAVDAWTLGVLSLVSAIIIILWSVDSWKGKGFTFSPNLIQLPVLGLILIGLIQLLPLRSVSTELLSVSPVQTLSIAPYQTRFAIIQLIIYLVFFAAAFLVLNNEKRQRKIVYIIIIFGAIMAFFGILQNLSSQDDLIYGVREAIQANPFASFVNKHHFAAFMEMTIALPLALLFGKATEKDQRVLLIIAAVIMGMAILFTGSRGGFLGLLGVLGFIITANILKNRNDSGKLSQTKKIKNYRRNFAMFGGGLALLIVILGFVLYLTNDSTLTRVVSMQGTEDITNGRTHFWSIAWQIFKDYPILGSGLDSYGTAFPNYDTWNGIYRLESAHNDYLQILSDAGILGFLCVASFIYLLFKQSLRIISNAESRFRRNTAIGGLAGCFGILVHSFFDFPLRTPSNSFFFLTLAVLATASIHTSQKVRRRKRKDG
jgi:O-antigen ligase